MKFKNLRQSSDLFVTFSFQKWQGTFFLGCRVGERSRFLALLFCGKGFRASFEALRTKKENITKMGELLDFL